MNFDELRIRGWTDYCDYVLTPRPSHRIMTVQIKNALNFPYDSDLFVDLFFLPIPKSENGHTWGISISDKHNYKYYVNLCTLIKHGKHYAFSKINNKLQFSEVTYHSKNDIALSIELNQLINWT